jgi:outer membrane receptor protein involved in Fe transport
VESNVFQPDILFRGFTASPVAGTSEGLAVYVNGMRFNDAFGDTVNWDLIPSVAIGTVNVEASNPVFGLNALGGSVNVQLKNGFTSQGGDATGYYGSYNRQSTPRPRRSTMTVSGRPRLPIFSGPTTISGGAATSPKSI